MAMVSPDGSSQSFGKLTAQICWFGLRVGSHPALSLHSSNEPGELSQWLCHDDSTINIVVVIIMIIIIIIQQNETSIVLPVNCPERSLNLFFASWLLVYPVIQVAVIYSLASNSSELLYFRWDCVITWFI